MPRRSPFLALPRTLFLPSPAPRPRRRAAPTGTPRPAACARCLFERVPFFSCFSLSLSCRAFHKRACQSACESACESARERAKSAARAQAKRRRRSLLPWTSSSNVERRSRRRKREVNSVASNELHFQVFFSQRESISFWPACCFFSRSFQPPFPSSLRRERRRAR